MRIQPSVSIRARALIAALALCALPVAARAVEIPTTAIDANTLMVVWMDAAALDQMEQNMPAMMANVPADKKAEAEKGLVTFKKYRKELAELGFEGLLIGVGQNGEEPEPFLLAKTKPGADRAKIEKLIHSMAEEAKGQSEQTAILATKVEKYGNSTTWHAITGEHLVSAPLNGTAADAAAFSTALKPVEKAPFQLCFRMLPKMKAEIQAKLDEQLKNPDAGGDMMAAMMTGMLEPMTRLETIVASGDMAKDAKAAGVIMHFADAKSAGDFSTSFNGLVDMGKGMANMQMAQMAKYGLDTKNANEVMAQIVLKADKNDAVMKMDNAFFGKVETLVMQGQAAAEKMKKDMDERRKAAAPAQEEGDDDEELKKAEEAAKAAEKK